MPARTPAFPVGFSGMHTGMGYNSSQKCYSLPIAKRVQYSPIIEQHLMKEIKMTKGLALFASGVLFLIMFPLSAAAQGTKITVLNPRGIQPPIRRIPMAARPATLEGKTIYLVDTGYPRTREFIEALFAVLKERYPKTTWILRDKFGGYVDDDPKLWAEVKEKGHGIIMGVGH